MEGDFGSSMGELETGQKGNATSNRKKPEKKNFFKKSLIHEEIILELNESNGTGWSCEGFAE